MKKVLLFITTLIILFYVAYKGYFYLQHKNALAEANSKYLNTVVIEASGYTLDNRRYSLIEQRGKNIILIFWASWCPDCTREIPAIKLFQNSLDENSDIVIISSSVDKDINKLKKFLEKNSLNYPVLVDEKNLGSTSEFNKHFPIVVIPSIWVINKKGVVVGQNLHHFDNAVKLVESL